MQITDKEVQHIHERLREELLAVKKCLAYADRLSDTQAKELCQKLARKHQEHYDRLLQRLEADL